MPNIAQKFMPNNSQSDNLPVTLRIIWHKFLRDIWHNGEFFRRASWTNSHSRINKETEEKSPRIKDKKVTLKRYFNE